MASRKGKMPPGLARYWAKKRRKKTKSRAKAPRKTVKRRVRRMAGPTRRTLGRDVRAYHTSQVKTAKALINEELKAMRLKLSLLNKGISGRAGRRK